MKSFNAQNSLYWTYLLHSIIVVRKIEHLKQWCLTLKWKILLFCLAIYTCLVADIKSKSLLGDWFFYYFEKGTMFPVPMSYNVCCGKCFIMLNGFEPFMKRINERLVIWNVSVIRCGLINNLLFLMKLYIWAVIRTGITSKKIPYYMWDSACRRIIVKKAKIFWSYGKLFEFSRVWDNVESWLVHANKLFWTAQPYF